MYVVSLTCIRMGTGSGECPSALYVGVRSSTFAYQTRFEDAIPLSESVLGLVCCKVIDKVKEEAVRGRPRGGGGNEIGMLH